LPKPFWDWQIELTLRLTTGKMSGLSKPAIGGLDH